MIVPLKHLQMMTALELQVQPIYRTPKHIQMMLAPELQIQQMYQRRGKDDTSQLVDLKEDDILGNENAGVKVVEKRGSTISHFYFFLRLRVRRK